MKKKQAFNAEQVVENAVWNEKLRELSYHSDTRSYRVTAETEEQARALMHKLLNKKFRTKPVSTRFAFDEKRIAKSQQIFLWWKGRTVLYPYLQVLDKLQDEYFELNKAHCKGYGDDDTINRLRDLDRQIRYVLREAHFAKEPSPDFVKEALYQYQTIPRAWLNA